MLTTRVVITRRKLDGTLVEARDIGIPFTTDLVKVLSHPDVDRAVDLMSSREGVVSVSFYDCL